MTAENDSPADRMARWTAADAAIGLAAEAVQLRAQLADRQREADDLRARLGQLSTRVAQLEAVNAELRRTASRVPVRPNESTGRAASRCAGCTRRNCCSRTRKEPAVVAVQRN